MTEDFHLAISMTFVSEPDGTDEQFEEFLGAVVEHLDAIGREVNLAARLTERVADFATTARGADFIMATAGFLVDLRTALHAAGCHTPNWPTFRPVGHTVRELEDA